MSEPTMLIVGSSRSSRRGRRPMAETRASNSLRYRVTDKQKEDLQEIARAEGRPMAAVFRDAVDEYVADYRERRVFQSNTKANYQPE